MSKVLLTHDGQTYQRSKGTWVNTLTHCIVSAAEGQRLDVVARKDAALWSRCLQRDALDRPTRRGSRGLNSHGLVAAYFDEAQKLRLTADLVKGWRRSATSWRFGAKQVVDLLGGWTLSCKVEVTEDGLHGPKYEEELDPDFEWWAIEVEAPEIPAFPGSEETEGEIKFFLNGTEASFEIPLFCETDERELNRSLPWRFVNGRWEFYEYRGGIYECYKTMPGNRIKRPFCFRLTGVRCEPPRQPVGATWEHDLPFPSAGLPSLGKRR